MVPVEDETALAPFAPPAGPPSSRSLRSAPSPGQRIGKYVVERTLGSGGMGVVVSARHEALGERVAIKVLHAKEARDAVSRERFVREARSLARIKSEHVVRVLDAGVDEVSGSPFLVMEHLDGVDLGQHLAEHGPMPVEVAADTIIQICEAVAAAHAIGIVHRDLKPSNFFLTRRPDGTALVKVLDFGISKVAENEGIPDPRLTETQAVFGSPTYMSPEQIRSAKNVDARSDVWSLGVALFELLTYQLPFVADNVAGLLASVIADPPRSLTELAPHVPRDVEAIVYACLEKTPARRIGSATELATRLASFATVDGAHLASRLERGSRPGSGSFLPPPPTRPSVGAPAFSRTTGDLSATAPASRKGGSRLVAFGLVALGLAVLVVAVAVTLRVRVAAPPRATAATAATAVTAEVEPAPLHVATPLPSAPSSNASAATPPEPTPLTRASRPAKARSSQAPSPVAPAAPTAPAPEPAVAPAPLNQTGPDTRF